jgi:CDP-glycerol glycerophosphotransferase (TagB/SpsB family)
MRRLIKLLWRPLQFVLYCLGGFFPRDPRLWLFGSWHGERFADNSKWLFLYAAKQRSTLIRCVWISKDATVVDTVRSLGFEAYHAFTPKGWWLCLRAGVYVFDCYSSDINFWLSSGAAKVNLWHGIPLKKVERDIDNPQHFVHRGHHGNCLQRAAFWVRAPWMAEKAALVLSTSELVQRLHASAFGLPVQQVPVTGFPRNDAIGISAYEPLPEEMAFCERIRNLKADGKRLAMYMPTFRDHEQHARQIPLDWARLNEFLSRHNAAFLVKLHRNDRASLPDLAPYPWIVEVDSKVDVYPLLRQVDVLVTDYSSIYFDYLLLDRPIVFYAYDLDQYIDRSRSLYVDYQSATPGPKPKSFEELLSALSNVLVESPSFEQWNAERENVRQAYHFYRDYHSSERVWSQIYEHVVNGRKQ